MKITHIIVRNASTLDYSIPYLCALREKYKSAEIYVFYCVLNRKQILRKTKYYDAIFSEYNIKQYDYSDFLTIKSKLMIAVVKKLFSFSYYDHVSLRSFIKNPFFLRCKVIKYIMAGPRKKLDDWICSNYVDTKDIIATLNPDLTLYDHRSRVDITGKDDFIDFFETKNTPVILVPHATHVDNETDEYMPFSLGHTEFPRYCDHWSSFKYAKPYLKVHKSQRKQFSMIGHPGLDSVWLNRKVARINEVNTNKTDGEALRVLVLSRKFLSQGKKKSDGMDPGVLEFNDVLKFFENIDSSLNAAGLSYKIIVKPHPSSSYPENIRVLKKARIENYEISYEPFFEILNNIDIFITEFSTSIAFPVLANVPTIVLNSPLQSYVHGNWYRLEELYSGLRYFVADPNKDLTAVIIMAVQENLFNDVRVGENDDTRHFRRFYDDNAIERALIRTEYLLLKLPHYHKVN